METDNITNSLKDFWQSLDFDKWLSDLGISYSLPVQAVLCFGSGFAIGFLFKKYFKFLLFSLLFAFILIKFFEHNSIVVIDWSSFRLFFGFEPDANTNSIINTSFEWLKENVVIFIASIVGFLFGYKLG